MCFHPDHWTWWVVRPSNLVDFIAMAKMKEAIQELPVCFAAWACSKKLVGNRDSLPGSLPFGHWISTPPKFDNWVFPWNSENLPSPPKKGKDPWASSKHQWGMLVFWGCMTVGWNEIQTSHSPTCIGRSCLPSAPKTGTKILQKKDRSEVEVLDLKLKPQNTCKKAELNKCW